MRKGRDRTFSWPGDQKMLCGLGDLACSCPVFFFLVSILCIAVAVWSFRGGCFCSWLLVCMLVDGADEGDCEGRVWEK